MNSGVTLEKVDFGYKFELGGKIFKLIFYDLVSLDVLHSVVVSYETINLLLTEVLEGKFFDGVWFDGVIHSFEYLYFLSNLFRVLEKSNDSILKVLVEEFKGKF